MKELTKSIVAMALIAIVGVSAMNHGFNGELLRYCIIAITAVALGADVIITYLEGRNKNGQTKI